ncbi:MAG: pyruvate dehydrogenase (acetyl-transferring) E1 component subunit alpha [Parcubacteria group bacterium]|nr:pyruvate dehydrogenase (acetyl-transferring) E1 component subunit alpha [Parcubacteria group bacterium]
MSGTRIGKVTFDLHLHRFLDERGAVVKKPLPPFAEDPSELLSMYRWMVLARVFDAKAVNLQKTGQLGTYPSVLGQEAVSVAIGSVMRSDDVFLLQYREGGALFMRGVPLQALFLFWGGDERGSAEIARHGNFPVCIPIATHALHAAGAAFAFKYRGESRIAVCALGDGATSEGDFYEALNWASVFLAPVVFVISNNQWAISVPRQKQTAAPTLAQKAVAFGMPCVRVDGNDIIAVRHILGEACAAARAGKGPVLVEAETYRLGDHTTADAGSAGRYRSVEEVSAATEREPIARLRAFLTSRGMLRGEDDAEICASIEAGVEAEKDAYLRIVKDAPRQCAAMFDHLYASLPPSVARQKAEFIREKGDAP